MSIDGTECLYTELIVVFVYYVVLRRILEPTSGALSVIGTDRMQPEAFTAPNNNILIPNNFGKKMKIKYALASINDK